MLGDPPQREAQHGRAEQRVGRRVQRRDLVLRRVELQQVVAEAHEALGAAAAQRVEAGLQVTDLPDDRRDVGEQRAAAQQEVRRLVLQEPVARWFERYGEAFDPRTGEGGLEIWIPVAA